MENNVIILSLEQREQLKEFTRSGKRSAKLIRRANVILALDRSNKKDHLRVNRICEQFSISRQGIADIRAEFLNAESIENFLSRKKRETPPVESQITGDVEAHIIALACSEPPHGYARWTLRFLAEKSVELNFVDKISHTSISNVLKKHNLSRT